MSNDVAAVTLGPIVHKNVNGSKRRIADLPLGEGAMVVYAQGGEMEGRKE